MEADRVIGKNEFPDQVKMARETLSSAEERARIATDILRAMANEPEIRRTRSDLQANRVSACRGIVGAGK